MSLTMLSMANVASLPQRNTLQHIIRLKRVTMTDNPVRRTMIDTKQSAPAHSAISPSHPSSVSFFHAAAASLRKALRSRS